MTGVTGVTGVMGYARKMAVECSCDSSSTGGWLDQGGVLRTTESHEGSNDSTLSVGIIGTWCYTEGSQRGGDITSLARSLALRSISRVEAILARA